MKIIVLGAGGAGLIALKHSLDYGCEVIAFEQTSRVGGTWVLNDEVNHGLEVHSSMYDNLVTHLPIEVMSYPNEPFPSIETSFVTSDVVLNYYESFADKYNLRDHIKFEHLVIRIQPLANDSWEVIVKNLVSKQYETHHADAVLVCNGHFSSPFIPDFDGRKKFKGKQIHSHEYRNAEPFKDEDILVIGGNLSAVDVVEQTSVKAKSVTWSHHLKDEPDLKVFGGNVLKKPDLMRLTGDGAEFTDGSFKKFDSIIFCTGYNYSFTFLSVNCGISIDEDYVKPLWKHCLNINKTSMSFIGLSNLICPNQMFSLQVRFCLEFMTGKKKLPTKEEMMKDYEDDMAERWRRGLSKKKAHVMGPDIQDEYYKDLAVTAGVEPIKPVFSKLHKFSQIKRNLDFMNYRDVKFFIIDDENFESRPI